MVKYIHEECDMAAGKTAFIKKAAHARPPY